MNLSAKFRRNFIKSWQKMTNSPENAKQIEQNDLSPRKKKIDQSFSPFFSLEARIRVFFISPKKLTLFAEISKSERCKGMRIYANLVDLEKPYTMSRWSPS